jgi:hypothetical protein
VATVLAAWGNDAGAPFLLEAFNGDNLPPRYTFDRPTSRLYEYTWEGVSTALVQLGRTEIVPVLLNRLEQVLETYRLGASELPEAFDSDDMITWLGQALGPFKVSGVASRIIDATNSFRGVSYLMTKEDVPHVLEYLQSLTSISRDEIWTIIGLGELTDRPEDVSRMLSLALKVFEGKPRRHVDHYDLVRLSDALKLAAKRAGVQVFRDGRVTPIDNYSN